MPEPVNDNPAGNEPEEIEYIYGANSHKGVYCCC